MRILFTGVGRRIELIQAFREAALVLGKDLKIFAADVARSAPALPFCDDTREIVPMKDPAYIRNLLEICKNDRIDLVIPTIDTDLIVLSENKEAFSAIGTRVMVSEPDKIRICRDKNYIAQFFVDCGLHSPLPVSDWKKYDAGFPAFIKPKDGSSSIDAYKVDDMESLKAFAARIQDYIIQPYISGKEYTIDIFCDWDGVPCSIVPRERLQVRSGEVNKTRIFMDVTMIEESKQLCKRFKPCGPLTVQLIRDSDGIDWFIEVNPRYGGGAPLSMKAGARSAEAVLKLLDGEHVAYQDRIQDGAIYSRFDQSVCIETGCVSGTIKGVIFDLDDTLFSEKEYVKSGYKAVSDYLGGGYEDRLWSFFEAGKAAIDELLKEIGREREKEAAVEVYRSNIPVIHPYPGVVGMIEKLKDRGMKVGIITDGRPEGQRNKLEALKIDVDDVIITDELGGVQFRKPCDIAYRILLRRWRLPASQVVYVGDNVDKDFQAPQQLGMKSVWFRNSDGIYCRNSAAGGDKIHCIDAIEDILAEIV